MTVCLSICVGCSWQLFIDADRNRDTGYGGGWEYVVRGVDNDVPGYTYLRDFAAIQREPERFSGNRVVRHTDGYDGLLPNGWGPVAAWVNESGGCVELPEWLAGDVYCETYLDGELQETDVCR